MSRRLAMKLVEHYRREHAGRQGLRPIHSPLTDREWEVVDLLSAGAGTEDIARALVLSTETVRSHLKRIHRKLGVRSRADAVRAGPAACATTRRSPPRAPSAAPARPAPPGWAPGRRPAPRARRAATARARRTRRGAGAARPSAPSAGRPRAGRAPSASRFAWMVEHAGDDVAVAAQRRVGAARQRGAQRAEARDEHAAGARELAERPLQPHALEHVLREVLQEQRLVDDALRAARASAAAGRATARLPPRRGRGPRAAAARRPSAGSPPGASRGCRLKNFIAPRTVPPARPSAAGFRARHGQLAARAEIRGRRRRSARISAKVRRA